MIERKPSVVYFGNKLSTYKSIKSVLETLEPLFVEFVTIKSYSSKKNKSAKLIDMVYHLFSEGLKADKIIIDVYSTSAFYFAVMLGGLSALFSKKYILFLHGGNLPARYRKSTGMVNNLFRNASVIVAPSNYLKSFFEQKGYDVLHIPNIIEIQYYPFKDRTKIKPTLLSLRGFGNSYNPLMTLKATILLSKIFPDVQLLLLGNKEEFYYEEVTQFIKENKMESIVTIKPKCSREEWIKVSENFDIMISNPVIDNTPISLLEGMALGMTIIATNVGGVPYFVSEKEVFFVENNDANGLFETIKNILNDNTLAISKMKDARTKAENHSWQNIKSKWQSILIDYFISPCFQT